MRPTPRISPLHRLAIWGLVAVTLFWAIYSLISGANEYGGGLSGLLQNSPNAIPWVLLLLFLYLAHRHPIPGGLIVAVLGGLTVLAFDTLSHPLTFATITVPYVVLGLLLALGGLRERRF